MSEPDEVTLQLAAPSDAPVLTNLLELYMHDLSEVFPIEVGPDGRFGYGWLGAYWQEPERRFPHLIRAGSQLVGFALATRGSPLTDDPNDLDVAEFFVLRRHRRNGVGLRAACLLWDRIPGRWIVRVAADNVRALGFWRSAVAEYTGVAPTEQRVEMPARAWHVLELRSRAASGSR
jgi:predicted acetyltransferase